MTYILLKLVSGELIISENQTVDSSAEEYVLKGPAQLSFQLMPDGKLGLRMIPMNPFMNSPDETIVIKKAHVMFELPVPQDIINQYIQVTSGLVVPSPGDKSVIS